MNILAFLMPGGFEILIIMVIYSALFIIPVIAFWKICVKAGFDGRLGLLMLVPIANLVLSLYLAFADWPALSENAPSSSGQM